MSGGYGRVVGGHEVGLVGRCTLVVCMSLAFVDSLLLPHRIFAYLYMHEEEGY